MTEYPATNSVSVQGIKSGKIKVTAKYKDLKASCINTIKTENGIDRNGTQLPELEYRFTLYMKNHGITVKMKTDNWALGPLASYIKATKKNFDEYRDGYFVVSIKPVKVYETNGKQVGDLDNKGNHTMLATKFDTADKINVLSWGRHLIVFPKKVSAVAGIVWYYH